MNLFKPSSDRSGPDRGGSNPLDSRPHLDHDQGRPLAAQEPVSNGAVGQPLKLRIGGPNQHTPMGQTYAFGVRT